MSIEQAVLYVVATPIGNLEDISERARRVLREVDLIAAEDTRHSRGLLAHLGLSRPMLSLHEHNERGQVELLLAALAEGRSVALVADAGTPLISDPGYVLVREVRRRGYRVVPIPGPSALISALSVAGLPTSAFVFEGFPPREAAKRLEWLRRFAREPRTLVLYEASHRILDSLRDLVMVMGADREARLARELTKIYETILDGTLEELVQRLEQDPEQRRGEFVVLVAGAPAEPDQDERLQEALRILALLRRHLPMKQALGLTVEITGVKRNLLYREALAVLPAAEE